MKAALQALEAGAATVLERPLTNREAESFEKYLKLLLKWQRVSRLVGSSDPAWIVENLFLDSLLFVRVIPPGSPQSADLGSGAGFPGIPIRIVRPDIAMTLIESRERRASFLSTAVRELELTDLRIVKARAEALTDELPGAFDAVVARCAGEIEGLLPASRRLLAPGGALIFAGPPSRRPLPSGGRWVEVNGWNPGQKRRFAVFGPEGI